MVGNISNSFYTINNTLSVVLATYESSELAIVAVKEINNK